MTLQQSCLDISNYLKTRVSNFSPCIFFFFFFYFIQRNVVCEMSNLRETWMLFSISPFSGARNHKHRAHLGFLNSYLFSTSTPLESCCGGVLGHQAPTSSYSLSHRTPSYHSLTVHSMWHALGHLAGQLRTEETLWRWADARDGGADKIVSHVLMNIWGAAGDAPAHNRLGGCFVFWEEAAGRHFMDKNHE